MVAGLTGLDVGERRCQIRLLNMLCKPVRLGSGGSGASPRGVDRVVLDRFSRVWAPLRGVEALVLPGVAVGRGAGIGSNVPNPQRAGRDLQEDAAFPQPFPRVVVAEVKIHGRKSALGVASRSRG